MLIPGLLEHLERAGVHSGDSIGVFPPQTVSAADQDLIVVTMERIVRALGVRGLVNAQFIVRDDGVYLIEVNPRASRTVPFMCKVTGVPMVDLAVRIALGERLADLGWPNGLLPPPDFVAVKAPAFSTAKLRGVDPSLGPGMQSTGEVIGIHEDPRVATAKALVGAGLVPAAARRARRPGAPDRRRPRQGAAPPAGRRAREGRLPVRGDAGHAGRPGGPGPRRGAGRQARRWSQAPGEADPRPDRLGRVRLVVNTPTPRSGPVRDAAEIRLAAIAEGVPCLTAMETAVAAAEAIDPGLTLRLAEVRPLHEWVAAAGVPRSATP